VTHLEVFLYIPNIVDYTRYALAITAMYFAFYPEQWHYFILFYSLAILGDAFDGKLARMFK
jgi:phosphatidylglycerophosphate synthase